MHLCSLARTRPCALADDLEFLIDMSGQTTSRLEKDQANKEESLHNAKDEVNTLRVGDCAFFHAALCYTAYTVKTQQEYAYLRWET